MGQVEIVDYRDEWPMEFEAIGREIRIAFGDVADRIDHIGSTSVPGLAAKDVIDVQVSVGSLVGHDFSSVLEELGYRNDPDARDSLVGVEESSPDLRKSYFWVPEGRPVHVHVRATGRLNQQYALLFRDYLRASPAVRDAYQLVKEQLAERFANDIASYYAIKDPYMDTVYAAARLWQEATGWSPSEDYL